MRLKVPNEIDPNGTGRQSVRSKFMRIVPDIDPAQPPTIELTPDEARQGVMAGRMQYVLGVSLALCVVANAVILTL